MSKFHPWRCYLVFGILLSMPTTFLLAQGKAISLSDLILASKNYYPSIQQKNAELNRAKASAIEIKHSFLPQLKFNDQINIGSDNSLAGSYLPIGITPSTSSGIRGDNNMQAVSGNIAVLYSEYELVNFGLNKARLNNEDAIIRLGVADVNLESYALTIAVAKTYFQLLKIQNRLDVDQQNVDRYLSVFNVIHALSSSGLIAGVDSSLAKAELSKARMNYQQTLGTQMQLKIQMSALTGLPSLGINLQRLLISDLNTSGQFEKLNGDSVTNPLLDYFQKKKEIFISNQKLIAKAYLPKIILAGSTWARGSSIQYNDQYKELGAGLGYQRFNYSFGVGFTYNLFNGIYKKDKLLTNKYQLESSDFDLQKQKLTLNTGILQSESVLLTAEKNLQELPIQLNAAEDVYRQKMAQYRAGIISLIDLTNASFVLYRSQTDYLEVITDWYLAQINKSAFNGTLEQFLQSIK